MVEETDPSTIFGEWLKRRRRQLDLTQAELAQRAGCSVFALRKIEAGDRRPSKQLAGLLAGSLELPPEEQPIFIRAARGEINHERLHVPSADLAPVSTQELKPASFPYNIPIQPTPLVGRETELAAMESLFSNPDCRLLTLTGMGGIGKTRLAVEFASRQSSSFPGGTFYIPLAAVNSSESIVPAVADVLGYSFSDPTDLKEQLLSYMNRLLNQPLLLILDNLEHLLSSADNGSVGVIELVSEFMQRLPQVKILTTSRERLNLRGEWTYELYGLPVPPSVHADHPEEYGAVRLFVNNALRARVDFELTTQGQAAVINICRLLDGIPLAIELASAWVGLLSCEEIAQEIESNIDFLATSMRDIPERHRSIRASFDHSWNLLSFEDQDTLSRLSVFCGGFDRTAAEQVAAATLTRLASLVSKSLVRRLESGRYDLHDVIQQYALLKLAENPGENESQQDKHASYYARHLSDWAITLKSSKQTETLAEMAIEIDNLRQAWEHMVSCCDLEKGKNSLLSPALFHNSLFSLSLFYELRCRNWEAITVFGRSIESLSTACRGLDEAEDRAYFEVLRGHVTAYLGLHHGYVLQYQKSRVLLEASIHLLHDDQSKTIKAQAQIMLSWINITQGQLQKAIDILEEACSVFRERGEAWWYGVALSHLAWAYLSLGRVAEGKTLYQEGLKLAEPGDLRLWLPLRNGLAYADYLQGRYAEAEQALQENLELSHRLDFKRQTALVYLDLGQVALATNRLEQAELNFQKCVEILSEFGESHDLAMGLVYLGKSLIVRGEAAEARNVYLRVIRIGQVLQIFQLMYWGLVHIARTLILEGQSQKALEMGLVLSRYSIEYKTVQKDAASLLEDLETMHTQEQIETARARMESRSIDSLLGRLQ